MHMVGALLANLSRNQLHLLRRMDSHKNTNGQGSPEQRTAELADTLEAASALGRDPGVIQIARLAGLLHDLGHAPFSHSGERFLPSWEAIALDLDKGTRSQSLGWIPDWLREALLRKIERTQSQATGTHAHGLLKPVKHEFYSLLMIADLFAGPNRMPSLPGDMGQDVASLLDEDISMRPDSPLARHGVRTLLSQLVTGEIDADRMDYLRRDATHCGVVYGLFDSSRICEAVLFYRDLRTKELNLAIHESGLAAYEDFLRARMSMYRQVYFHKTSTACEAMLSNIRKKIGNFVLPIDIKQYLDFDDESFYFKLHGSMPHNVEAADGELRSLLFNRQLWKRVYEENHATVRFPRSPSLTMGVLQFLRRKGLAAEIIESETSLTRFSPKGRARPQAAFSMNSLKVFVKQQNGSMKVLPIEDYSRLINDLDEERTVQRVFVDPTHCQIGQVRSAIARYIGSPEADTEHPTAGGSGLPEQDVWR
jgi:HD superfamily phosphohydrolase